MRIQYNGQYFNDSDDWEEGDLSPIDYVRYVMQDAGRPMVGLNADWSLEAYELDRASQSYRYGILLWDPEIDNGQTWEIVFASDRTGDYPDSPSYFEDETAFRVLWTGPWYKVTEAVKAYIKD
jgi:hypothetical protein